MSSAWICPQCTLQNHTDVHFCEACHLKRSSDLYHQYHPQQSGIIIEWGFKNGFWNGYVIPDNGNQKIFVDGRDFHSKLFNGDRILFTIGQATEGLKATEITKQPFQSGTIIEWECDNYWSGFVATDKGGQRVFVDGRDFNGKLFVGDHITFKVFDGLRGPKAIRVKKVRKQTAYNSQKKTKSVTMTIWDILCCLRYLTSFTVIILPVLYVTVIIGGINAIFWSIPILLLTWISARNSEYIKSIWDWKSACILVTFVLTVFNTLWLYDHEGRIQGLEYLPATIKDIDRRLTNVTNKIDNDFYTPLIDKNTYAKTIDDILVASLERMGISRAKLRMGCFMEGTQIQIDKYGNTANVESLRNGDYVFNPILNKQVEILWIYGNETGYMYTISSNDSLSVTVTKKHAMKICSKYNDNLYHCYHNIAAQHVYKGNWTLTNNGYQQIVSIKKIPVKNVRVYNLWLNVLDNVSISSRAVIANGIYTLDFSAQQIHENNQ